MHVTVTYNLLQCPEIKSSNLFLMDSYQNLSTFLKTYCSSPTLSTYDG